MSGHGPVYTSNRHYLAPHSNVYPKSPRSVTELKVQRSLALKIWKLNRHTLIFFSLQASQAPGLRISLVSSLSLNVRRFGKDAYMSLSSNAKFRLDIELLFVTFSYTLAFPGNNEEWILLLLFFCCLTDFCFHEQSFFSSFCYQLSFLQLPSAPFSSSIWNSVRKSTCLSQTDRSARHQPYLIANTVPAVEILAVPVCRYATPL